MNGLFPRECGRGPSIMANALCLRHRRIMFCACLRAARPAIALLAREALIRHPVRSLESPDKRPREVLDHVEHGGARQRPRNTALLVQPLAP